MKYRQKPSGIGSSGTLQSEIDCLTDYLRKVAAEECGIESSAIDVDQEICPDPNQLVNLLRARVQRDIGFPLYMCDAPSCVSIRAVAEHIAHERKPEPLPQRPLASIYEGGRWAWGPIDTNYSVGQNIPIVFVLSAPRSGSTLLQVMLANHYKLFAPPELNLLQFSSMKERAIRSDSLGYGWMRRGLTAAFCELEGLTQYAAEQKSAKYEKDDVGTYEVYDQLFELASGRTLIDKSPAYACHPEWLWNAERRFAGARYLHLVREPNAAIESFVRMRFHRLLGHHWLVWDDNGWLYAEKFWTSANAHICDALQGVEPCRRLVVRYEELVTNPTAVTRGICAFVGVDFDHAVLSPYESRRALAQCDNRSAMMGDPNVWNHSSIDGSLAERWRTAPVPQRLSEATMRVAAMCGYYECQDHQGEGQVYVRRP